MNILALETTAKSVSAAICRDDFLLAEYYQNTGMTHSSTLMPICEDLLNNTNMSLSDIDLIASANGPGSFTGLRIGLATAKGLAWAEEKNCVGVSTLEAMAYNVSLYNGIICCVMDARRKQVYNAVFEIKNNVITRLCEDRAISIEELFTEELLAKEPLLIGDGSELCYNYCKSLGFDDVPIAPPNLRYQHAYGVAAAAFEQFTHGNYTDGQALSANYLRLSQAERERLEKMQKAAK